MIQRDVLLTLYNDKPSSTDTADNFQKQNILEKLKVLDSRARRKGLDALDPARNSLIPLGTEIDGQGKVTKNSYGVFNLSWQAEQHKEWPAIVDKELEEIRLRIRDTHGVPLKYLIWAGMGGSAEDKSTYNAIGLLKRGPRVYVLDSTDPAKLKSILEDIEKRSGKAIADALKSTLVVGMAMGMTSYEPVVNLEKLSALYAKSKVDSAPNFVYMTLPDSLLDQFGRRQGYRKVELQLDNGNSTAGRHSGPLTRGSLYPLGLAGVDLATWMKATFLSPEQVHTAWRLSSFLNAQAMAGRNKVTLLLAKSWAGAALWTKQDFEESLGKREDFGLKVIIDERPKLANYRSPKEITQDRCFLAVQVKGAAHEEAKKISALRRAGYPVAVLTVPKAELSAYMQFIHYTVFGIGYLQDMNFVTQPSVELYKAITNRLHAESQKLGGIEKTQEWTRMQGSPRRVKWRNALTLYYDRLPENVNVQGDSAPAVYAAILKGLAAERSMQYGELTFFGDTRYGIQGRAVRKTLDRAAERVFRSVLKMPADVYEGPAMNHSYHEMIIGHGKALSTVLLSEKAERIAAAGYTADYHRAQFLATQMALAERGRFVVAITLKDLEQTTLAALDEFFHQVSVLLKSRAPK
jgi:glucose-6-phosphate isomerase